MPRLTALAALAALSACSTPNASSEPDLSPDGLSNTTHVASPDLDPSNALPTTATVECDLDLDVSCTDYDVPSTSEDGDCDGKVESITFEYTGEGCDAGTNDQEGRAVCEGGSEGADGVTVSLADESEHADVNVGEEITFTAADGSLDSNSELTISSADGTELEYLEVHTSCSKPLSAGDQFGSLLVTEMTTTDGGTTTITPDDGTCDGSVGTYGDCDEKLTTMILRYTGEDCADPLANDQEGKAECGGVISEGAGVEIYGKDRKADKLAWSGSPAAGETFTVTPHDDKDHFESNTLLFVVDSAGEIEQEVEMHTSCSKPLAPGDVFGAFEVVALVDEDGLVFSDGGLAEWTYTLTNNGADTYTSVTLTDSISGVISVDVGDGLEPGDSVSVSVTGTPGADGVNDVDVLAIGLEQICEATETVEWEVEEAPDAEVDVPPDAEVDVPGPGEGSCDDGGRPYAVSFIWTGDDCTATTNDQEGNLVCTDGVSSADVNIAYTGKDTDKIGFDVASATIGDTITLEATGRDELHSSSVIELSTADGDSVQYLEVHTSCSKPLDVGDVFGGLTVSAIYMAD